VVADNHGSTCAFTPRAWISSEALSARRRVIHAAAMARLTLDPVTPLLLRANSFQLVL
jgi:hypothetical protein